MRLHASAIAILCLFATANAARAQEAETQRDPFAQTENLSPHTLSGQTVIADGIAIAQSTQTFTATNSGNSVTGETVTTGDVVLGAETFSGFGGIGNFLMNTGNNNNLQGAVSVVVVVPPS